MINFIYNIAPKDGTAIGTGLSTLAFDPLIGRGQPVRRAEARLDRQFQPRDVDLHHLE